MTKDTIQIRSSMKRRRRIKVGYNKSQTEQDRNVAAIRFSGTYLEDLGFHVGEFMDLIINDDLSITLRPIKAAQELNESDVRVAIKKTNE